MRVVLDTNVLIVSGDADLLALNPFRDIPIVTRAVFVQGAAR